MKKYRIYDIDYAELDTRIAPLVKFLREHKFNTFASCEGGEGHMHPMAWIRIAPLDTGFSPYRKWKEQVPYVMKEFKRLSDFIRFYGWPCTVNMEITHHLRASRFGALGFSVLLDLNFLDAIRDLDSDMVSGMAVGGRIRYRAHNCA